MAEDRRQNDRRVGEKDRRKGDRRDANGRKILTMTLPTFVTLIAVIAIIFVTTAAFMAVYYEKKLDEAEVKNDPNSQLQYPIDNTEYIDISNLVLNSTNESLPDDNTNEDVPTDNNVLENEVSENN